MGKAWVATGLVILLAWSTAVDGVAQKRGYISAELDVLPYATGGFFGGAAVGSGLYQVRGLVAHVHLPDLIVRKGFTANRISAYALLLDRFSTSSQGGLWMGMGPVVWKGEIGTKETTTRTRYTSYLINASAGFTHFLTERLYLSPWAGVSIRVAGDERIQVEESRYTPPLFNPEVSLKVGWRFAFGPLPR